MGIKDKFKNAWQRVSDLDDESAQAKEQAAEGERIPYQEISKKLKELMKKNVDVVGRKILIPGYYKIYFSEYDREQRREVEKVLCEELKEELFPEMRKINPEQNKNDLLIEVETDPSLVKGQFRVDFRMKRPQAGEEPEKASPPPKPQAPPPSEEDLDLQPTVTEEETKVIDPDDQPTVVQPESRVEIRVAVESEGNRREMTFSKERITLGRASHDDVVLESPDFSISRGHAVVEYRDGQLYLLPVGVNGTILNGQELELQQEVPISADDEIKIINHTLNIRV